MPDTAPILDHVVIDVRDRMDEAARVFTGLGFRLDGPGPVFADNGVVHTLSQHLNGGSVRGGVGYNLPGTDWRAEVGASYLRASGSSSSRKCEWCSTLGR